jgi:hypothetical protein
MSAGGLKNFEKGHPSPFKIWAAHFLNILGENEKLGGKTTF